MWTFQTVFCTSVILKLFPLKLRLRRCSQFLFCLIFVIIHNVDNNLTHSHCFSVIYVGVKGTSAENVHILYLSCLNQKHWYNNLLCVLILVLVTAVQLCTLDGVAQLVERRTQDSKDSGSNPYRSTTKNVWVFPSHKCCADSLSVCPIPVCIRTHKNKYVRTLKII